MKKIFSSSKITAFFLSLNFFFSIISFSQSIKDTSLVNNINSKPKQESLYPNGRLKMNIEPDLIYVEGGTYLMGSGTDINGNELSEEKSMAIQKAHSVTLSSFYLGRTEVTQKQWEDVMGNNPSSFKNCPNCPVESVSWDDANNYIEKLNKITNLQYRLPTEAEWEYAARGGIKTHNYIYAGATSDMIDLLNFAWIGDNCRSTKPVAKKKPNELGFFDLSGNVSEWCQDWYGLYSSRSEINPKGPSEGQYHIIRGGSWPFDQNSCVVGYRDKGSLDYKIFYTGFRIALSAQ